MKENEHTITVQRLMFTLVVFIFFLQIFTVFQPFIAQTLQCLYV